LKTKICRKVTDMDVSVAKVLKQCTPITLHEIPIENWMIGWFTLPELLKKLITKVR
jgi:phenylpyruvate tautomerase PptA (4-oxalocrotonate tautomerase family)